MIFSNRAEAGQVLAEKVLGHYPHLVGDERAVVLAIPRGGVVVAGKVSKVLKCRLDVVVVRKLGVPGHEEFGFGAVDLEGGTVLDEGTVRSLELTAGTIEAVRQKEFQEVRRRDELYRRGTGPLNLQNKIVILVDDGLATGATTQAAVNYVRHHLPSKIILSVPVAPVDAVLKLKTQVEDLIVLLTPSNFMAVGQFYKDFPQVSNEEVVRILLTEQPPALG